MAIDGHTLLGAEFASLKKNLQIAKIVLPDINKWFDEIDAGNYEQSWNDSAKSFQDRVPSSQWVDYLDHVRKPLGKCTSRELAYMPQLLDQISLGSNPPIKGDFLYAQYNSIFETQPHVLETVVFQKGDDGAWAMTAYQCKTP